MRAGKTAWVEIEFTRGDAMSAFRWSVLVFLVVMPGLLLAQQANLGGISGTVRDPGAALVTGAQVVAVNEGPTLRQEVKTDTGGGYVFTLLPVGTYTVTVTQSGFVTAQHKGIPVISGQSFTVDFQLAVGTVNETVSVTSAAPTVDTTTVNMGTTRTEQELKELP